MPKSVSPSAPYLELQVHPSNIRSGVRTYFFSRRRLRFWIAGMSAYGLLVLLALFLAPQ